MVVMQSCNWNYKWNNTKWTRCLIGQRSGDKWDMQVSMERVVVEEASSCIRSIVDRIPISKNPLFASFIFIKIHYLLLSFSLRPQHFFIDKIQNQHILKCRPAVKPQRGEKKPTNAL